MNLWTKELLNRNYENFLKIGIVHSNDLFFLSFG